MTRYFFYIFIYISELATAQVTTNVLKADWKFRQKGTEKFYPASVPGTVHTDLLTNRLIKDPYLSDNEQSVQWVENEDWEYSGTFNCDKSTFANKYIELNFEGLDTYASVVLNGTQILDCNNMFRSWKTDVKQYLKPGTNSVQIFFRSAVKKGKEKATELTYTLPGDEKIFTRKAQYQFGWDFGPRLVTCGIFKPISLICHNGLKFNSIRHHIETLNDSIADVMFITETESDQSTKCNLTIDAHLEDSKAKGLQNNAIYHIDLQKGINVDTFHYTIRNPQLWHSNGLGKPSLYGYDISVRLDDKTIDQKHLSIGLRTLELVQEKDFFGESFYFKLNGKPVFMKGANYIPQDNFISQTTAEQYHKIVQMAKDANMNMLRVWGGGVYADDEFYDQCDRNGILVWQDLMFACSMYPGDSAFVENVKKEIAQQVTRLQNHTCMALWCGNNEIDEGWHNWGWQKQFNYSKQDSSKIWNDYKHLFHEVIPSLIKTYDPETFYWPSSPSIGWGHKESLLRGDSHYWGVWWGNEPFEIYNKKVGRFMSEYGFQGMPDLHAFKSFCDSNELSLTSKSVLAHQKHPTGYKTIQTYMERDYIAPKDFNKYVYVSQLLQRDGTRTAIEAHHRAKPFCMGTLYWQLNDCWPVTSWSVIDHNCLPKALYYETKKLFKDVSISIHEERNQYDIFLISDKQEDIKAVLEISIKNMSGDILHHKRENVKLKTNSSNIAFAITDSIIKPFNKQEIYLSCQLKDQEGKLIAKKIYCFAKPKELKLQKPLIKIEPSKEKNTLLISSNTFVKDLYLFSDRQSIPLSDNFIDMEPGETIEISTGIGIVFYKQIAFLSLYDINH